MAPSDPFRSDAESTSEGSSPETAIVVGSIGEEYAWVAQHLPGARLVIQALTYHEERPFDVLTLETESGDQRQVYFDISSFFGRERHVGLSAALCPYCGAALRSEKAKQCFTCGTDWRDPENVIRRRSS